MSSGRLEDPHGFAAFADRLGSSSRKRAAAPALAASVLLAEGELVRDMVCGRYFGHDAVAVVTDRRLVVVNARPYAPDHDEVALDAIDEVKGWIDNNRATLEIVTPAANLVVGDISELEHAQEMAARLRGAV